MIHLALRDLRHDPLGFGFSVVGIGILAFAFLLLVPLSLALTRLGEADGLHQYLIIVERDVLQPEQSRISPGLAERVEAILGDRLTRVDPVIFRILRVEGLPLQLRGVAEESWASTFGLRLLDGAWPSEDTQVVMGSQAARDGGWLPGSEVNLYGRPFRVAAIVDGPKTQAETVWISYQAALDLFGRGKGAQLLVADLEATTDPLAAKSDLEGGLRSVGAGYDVYFEDALLREYGAALNDLRSLSLVALVIAIIAVTLGAHNLGWLAVEERSRPLGVLRALGFDRRAVQGYLLLRALVISMTAYLVALGAALAFLRFGAGTNRLTIGGSPAALEISPSVGMLGLLLACAACLLGTWISARRVLGASASTLLGRGPGGSLV